MKLGIIGAMSVEVEALKAKMENTQVQCHAGSEYFDGILEGIPAVVVQCGVGKVNAACDLVVSQDAMYHDFTVAAFGYPHGKVPGMDVIAFPADEKLVQLAYAAAEAVNPGHTKVGRVASGDQFVCEKALKDGIIANTQALCTEMEGAAIAHTAYRNGVPFVILRAISDKADGSAEMDYPVFETLAAHRCADVTCHLARALQK